MGAGASSASNVQYDDTAKRHSLAEFKRLCPEGQDHLVLSQIRKLQSIEGAPMDMLHLPTLFVLDSDRDGRVTFDELVEFAKLCARKSKDFGSHEFQMQMQGYCTLHMFDAVSSEGGVREFVAWFEALFSEDVPYKTFEDYPGVDFTTRDCVHEIHEVTQMDEDYGCSVQRFFDQAQRTGEEKGIMSILDERLDELIPVSVVRLFAKAYVDGFLRLMSDLHFKPEPPAR
uniref:EF-hand domain-containing protein n=1 Tax=Hemiselmis andersenii TaxID=464988 RepID=A0A6T8NAS5_HEMAN|mmetsp:Transcript_23903/g.55601  ORF Transcript_23903/g.55601 Transcript_23903/m.55601 type:complete len:229 (+) Transcript_23903:112-798(+)